MTRQAATPVHKARAGDPACVLPSGPGGVGRTLVLTAAGGIAV
ncbi:hypothetical protein ACFXPS_06105 [Nocardia sp. NPDC059091]